MTPEQGLAELARLFEFSPSCVFLVDCQGFVRYANTSFVNAIGLVPDALLGKSIETVGHASGSPLWASIETKHPWHGELHLNTEGRSFTGITSITPVIESTGECAYVLCTCAELRERAPETTPMTPATPLVLVVDVDGTILFIDRTVPGISREDAMGASIYEFMPAEHHERIRAYLAEVIETRESLSYEVPSVGPYGTVRTYEVHVGPIERDGEVVALSFVSWETSPNPTEFHDRYQLLADAGVEALIIHDGRAIIDTNEAACAMFSYEKAQLVGQPVAKLFAGRGRNVVSKAEFYETGKLHKLSGVRSDGTSFDIEVCGKSLPHRSGLSTVIAVRDIGSRTTPSGRDASPRGRRSSRSAATSSGPIELSERELDVLELLAQGMTNKAVSERIRVSARTVDHHVSHILAKLGVSNRTAAAMAARSKGLLRRKK